MWNKIIQIGALIIIAVLITGNIFFACGREKARKDYSRKAFDYNVLHAVWWRTITSPPKIMWRDKIIRVTSKPPRPPIPIAVPVKDSTATDPLIPIGLNTYDSIYDVSDSVKVKWRAMVYGYLDLFDIEWVEYTCRDKYIDRIAPPLPVDTARIVRMFEKKWNWGAWGGLFNNNVKEFPNIQVGLYVMYKRKWGIAPGVMMIWKDPHPANIVVNGTISFN